MTQTGVPGITGEMCTLPEATLLLITSKRSGNKKGSKLKKGIKNLNQIVRSRRNLPFPTQTANGITK